MDSELETLIATGREAYTKGDFSRAEEVLSQAILRGAAYADLHHMLGVVYHSWGLYSKARAAFEEALKINPHYTEAALNLAITYNDLGRYAEAKEILARSIPKEKEGELPGEQLTKAKLANLHAEVGDAYRSARMPKDAAIEFRRALGLCPRFVDIRTRLAQALIEDGRAEEAIEELRLALSDRPHYVPALLQLGLLLHTRGDTKGAREALEAVLAIQPGHDRAETYLRMLEPSERSD
jgi:tetratricopeptide (TPR) repeat protein